MPGKKDSTEKFNSMIPEINYDKREYPFAAPQEELDVQDAPFWRRTVAYALDMLFFYFVFFQVFMVIYLPKVGLNLESFSEMENYVRSTPSAYAHLIAGFVAASFVFLFYFMLFEKNFKTTPGKKIMGLGLLSGREITYTDVFLRNLTKTVLLVLLPIDLIGLPLYGRRFTELLTSAKVIYHKPLVVNGWMT